MVEVVRILEGCRGTKSSSGLCFSGIFSISFGPFSRAFWKSFFRVPEGIAKSGKLSFGRSTDLYKACETGQALSWVAHNID